MKALLPAVLLIASGCASARLMVARDPSAPNAPANETKGGVVAYVYRRSNAGTAKARKEAYALMADYCQGPYKIVSEGDQFRGTTIGDEGISYSIKDRYITFECGE